MHEKLPYAHHSAELRWKPSQKGPNRQAASSSSPQRIRLARRPFDAVIASADRKRVAAKEVIGNLQHGFSVTGRVVRLQHDGASVRIRVGPRLQAMLHREIERRHRRQAIVPRIVGPRQRSGATVDRDPLKSPRPGPLNLGPQQGVPCEQLRKSARSRRPVQLAGKPQAGDHVHRIGWPVITEHILFKGCQRQWKRRIRHGLHPL